MVNIYNNDVDVQNNLIVQGTITADNLNTSSTITGTEFATSDLLITQNYITTTDSNSDLDLRAAGTGGINIEGIHVNESTITTSSTLTFALGGESVNMIGTGAFAIPKVQQFQEILL